MDDVRQGIHFDLDTKALAKYYPKASWQAAYDDVRGFLERNGFVHEQGSGYRSVEPMVQAEAVDVLYEMRVTYPWLHKCVKVCTIADVPVTFDFTNLFDKNADIPERTEQTKIVVEPPQSAPSPPKGKPSLLGRLEEAKKEAQLHNDNAAQNNPNRGDKTPSK